MSSILMKVSERVCLVVRKKWEERKRCERVWKERSWWEI